jgi:membrane protein YdbS with pleckstrin-like domain
VQSSGPLDALPLWGLFVVILLVVLLSVECGYRLGKYRRSRHEQEKEVPPVTGVLIRARKVPDALPAL